MLKNIAQMAKQFENIDSVKKELKRVQSIKCRLKKQKERADYEKRMREILEYEQTLKEIREYFVPKKKPVTQYTQADIEKLSYEETLRAIKSIQSKKCNSQYLTKDLKDNIEYQRACEIERMLLEHKRKVKPVDEYTVQKSKIMDLINHIENLDPVIERDYVLELLRKLV